MRLSESPRSRSAAIAFTAAFTLLCVALPRCSSSPAGPTGPTGPSGATGPDGGPDGGTDAGPDGGPDAGSACRSDKDCGAARWCALSSGVCMDAKPCPQGQGNCDYPSNPPDYCAGAACFCDPADSACKPRHQACTACENNAQCGNDPSLDFPADCVTDAGVADGAVCLPQHPSGAACPRGYVPGAGRYCLPGGGKCGAGNGCNSDNDCDLHSATPLCDTARGVCIAACTFDLKTGASSCAGGLVCNLITAFAQLPPQDPNFARGRCGAPCVSGTTSCGTGLTCRSEGLDVPVLRCGLPPPQCLGDVECPSSPSTHSFGYCDLASHGCQTGCRTGADCNAGYLCNGGGSTSGSTSGTCVAETCLEAGGAATGCDYGQFCCGQDGGPPSCPGGVDAGSCYDKPAQTWCAACSADSDCRTGAFPSNPFAPALCVDPGKGKVCALGCDPKDPAACPRSWGCEKVLVGCAKQDDCSGNVTAPGTPHCDLPADGGTDGTCTCASNADCPSDSNNTSRCVDGKCQITSVCRPACP